MPKVNVVMPTGGNFEGETSTTTSGYCLTINGTKVVLIPVHISGVTYYMIAAENWAWASKT